MKKNETIILGTGSLSIEDIVNVARYGWQVAELCEKSGNPEADRAYQKMLTSRQWVDDVVNQNIKRREEGKKPKAYYGVNTGFGAKSGREGLVEEEIPRVTRNLLVSHASGTGRPLPIEVVRAAMLIRANSLSLGYSGIRPILVNTIVRMLNKNICPMVPEYGSVGASGDLAPLAHLGIMLSKRPESYQKLENLPEDYYQESGRAFMLIDESEHSDYKETFKQGNHWYAVLPAKEVMSIKGIDQLELGAKEGLAINNGATFSAAIGAIGVYDAERLVEHAEISAALSLEAMLGFRDAFFPHIQAVRNQPGQKITAKNIMKYIDKSTLVDGNLDKDPRFVPPQDPYSLRVTPQVIGAIRDGLKYIHDTIVQEVNAATDNPMIFNFESDDPLYLERNYRAVSGGNFHGAPVAYAMDLLKILMTDLSSLSERRTFRLTVPNLNHGLPPFLQPEIKPGITSGMMIPQYLAASLVSDSKTLSHPDSVDSIPTSGSQEDHVSMSMNAARHARQIIENSTTVVAVELLCASLGVFWRIHELGEKITDVNFNPEEKIDYERDRVDEIVMFYRKNQEKPKTGIYTSQFVKTIFEVLFDGDKPLPDLREVTMEDRFLQPYLLRIIKLVNDKKLLS